ncbi:LLM class flavin-dependent oxidoreductase [Cryobacterium sp. TMT1-3]|uniref:LLM class flavin-dependent oxidoreductase n=1 Tax=Cryobacterium sp. TMT1-3 TaxID=1259237 RepID=UPI00106BD4B3|nr:LLM class flavin-dependent oxidoreductase [Cryobacterium sp. TMT1-3]TFC25101.1 LLM class flavin-dependent oxidoreductase [Cryobacterium sp. TMT1-3]
MTTPAEANQNPTRQHATRQLHLNAFLMSTGHHEASWRLPESNGLAGTDVAHFQRLARIAEAGRFDSIFFADSPVLGGDVGRRPSATLEPTVLLTAIAAVTEHIGLIATASTTYNDPYNLARRFASIDHVSGGRAGWNVVTTAGDEAAKNFSQPGQLAHFSRYERASEFLDVAQKLWDSWDDDATVVDKASGVWADHERVHAINHEGEHFQVQGALTVPRSPQGHPLIVQAGSSEDGKNFAAEHAEAVFVAHQTLQEAQAFYADLKQRTRDLGRDPESIKILPGIVPIIAATEAEARLLEQQLEDLIQPEFARQRLASLLGRSPASLPLDEQLPADLPHEDAIEGAKSRYILVVELARREHLTVRQLIGRLGGGRGHLVAVGTATQIADTIQTWFESKAADGFNIMPAVLPSGLQTFVEQVLPILRARGLFRTEYAGSTLREHYGLPRPQSRFAVERSLLGASA